MHEGAVEVEAAGHCRGEEGFRRITWALFAAGMTMFIGLYSVQAVLPDLADAFAVTPATAALAVSAGTGALAVTVVWASALSERFGRRTVLGVSAVASAVVGLLIPLAPSLEVLLVLRVVQGVALAGVPATAMAYLAEEVHRDHLGAAMGRYVAGTTIGGLAGRVLTSFGLDLTDWRWGLGVSAVVALVFTLGFARLAPPSRHFAPQPVGVVVTGRHALAHLRSPALVALFLTGGLLMGGFVSVYNLLGFRLLAPPFGWPAWLVGLVFVLYLAGTVSSTLAGRLSDTHGRLATLVASEVVMGAGLLLTLVEAWGAVLVGMLLFTAGFFGAHAVASTWVGMVARHHRAEASALYLCAYYLGSSLLGALMGVPYRAVGWAGVVLGVGVAVLVALALAAGAARCLSRASD